MKANLGTPTAQIEPKWVAIGEGLHKRLLSEQIIDPEVIELEAIEEKPPLFNDTKGAEGNRWMDMLDLGKFLLRIISHGILWILVGLLLFLAYIAHGIGNRIRRSIDGGKIRPLVRQSPKSRNSGSEEIEFYQYYKIRRR